MLTFSQNLQDALEKVTTEVFWLLKLYYDDESSAVLVSDQDRIIGTDEYSGIVASWGSYHQSLNFFNFTTSTGNMMVTLINTPTAYQKARFSDFMASNNFANRKWELFLLAKGLADGDKAQIACGVISGKMPYDTKIVTLTLLDYSSKWHKRIPVNVVDSSTYPNAPEKNIDKPIPICYGDFSDKTGIGTPPAAPEFDPFFVKSRFPAIIVNKGDVNGFIVAQADSQVLNSLNIDREYIFLNDIFPHIDNSNGDIVVTEATGEIKMRGAVYYMYIQLSGTPNNCNNNDFSDNEPIAGVVGNGWTDAINMRVPQISGNGVIANVYAYFDYGTFGGVDPALGGGANNYWRVNVNGTNYNLQWNLGNELVDVSASFNVGNATDWNLEGVFNIEGEDDTNNDWSAEIIQAAIVIKFSVGKVEKKIVQEEYEAIRAIHVGMDREQDHDIVPEYYKETRTRTILNRAEIEYIYFSGKGREYGAWIDTINGNPRTDENGSEPDPNYNAAALIENAVYMIEDILRTELGLDAGVNGSDIDIETFDKAGNGQVGATSGDIAFIFNDAIADIIFALSQYKFINSKELIDRISRLILSWTWISGSGKFKIRTLLRPTDTFSEDMIIDFNDIEIVPSGIRKTPLGAVRNDITVKYNYDYGQDQNLSKINDIDAVSQGNTSSGYNRVLKLILDASEIIDSVTATQLADAIKTIFKDRKETMNIVCKRPKYNSLEITDIIKFSNWDTDIKIYGTAMGTDYYIVEDINKLIASCPIKLIKVS